MFTKFSVTRLNSAFICDLVIFRNARSSKMSGRTLASCTDLLKSHYFFLTLTACSAIWVTVQRHTKEGFHPEILPFQKKKIKKFSTDLESLFPHLLLKLEHFQAYPSAFVKMFWPIQLGLREPESPTLVLFNSKETRFIPAARSKLGLQRVIKEFFCCYVHCSLSLLA